MPEAIYIFLKNVAFFATQCDTLMLLMILICLILNLTLPILSRVLLCFIYTTPPTLKLCFLAPRLLLVYNLDLLFATLSLKRAKNTESE